MKCRIHDLRRNAEMWRDLAAEPEHEEFNKLRAEHEEFNKLRAEHEVFSKLRAECERVAAEVGCPFKIGEPKPPIHEANARLRNLIGWLRLFGRANPG